MFACVYIPDFPVEAILRAEPLLRERGVAVLEGKPSVRIIALNERARQMGMEAGMTKLQAAIFSDVVLRQRSREQEKSAHFALLDVAFGFSPRVEDTTEDRILLDLCGMERMHGSAANMARDLASRVSAAGLEANVAIVGNPDSAMHAACGFTGTTVLPAGEEARRLGVLPLHVLLDSFDLPRAKTPQAAAAREREKLRAQMLDTLERWGVRDFRMLALLPEHALASRLGQAGARLQRLARGAETRTLTLSEPEFRFEEVFELEDPIENLEPLSFILNRLLEQLCARLESRALAVHELHLRLQLERRVADEETLTASELTSSDNVGAPHIPDFGMCGIVAAKAFFERRLRLPVAMRDARVFLKLLQLDLSAHPPGAPVVKLWISAQPAPPRSAQRGLFLPLTPEAEKLEITLARIISIVGEHRAGIARLLDTHRPDAFAVERFTAPEDQLGSTLTMSEVARSAFVCPSHLSSRPAAQGTRRRWAALRNPKRIRPGPGAAARQSAVVGRALALLGRMVGRTGRFQRPRSPWQSLGPRRVGHRATKQQRQQRRLISHLPGHRQRAMVCPCQL